MSSESAIKVEHLSKCYQIYEQPRDRLKQFLLPRLQRAIGRVPKQYFREFWALENVHFEVKKGETVGIIGRNGSGKSTLLQMICGTLNPTCGSIQTNGRIAALLELGSGFNPEFTGRENVYLNGAVLGLSKEEIDSRFDQITAFADIGEFIDRPVKTYSSGMFVRLAFSIQANVEPEILIVDEALAVGDAYFVHRCMLSLRELQKAGTTILFVSHDVNLIRNFCGRAIRLIKGKIRDEGDAANVVDAYLADLFGQQLADSIPKQEARKITVDNQQVERSLPNIDRRLGDQRCEIIGVGLYDESLIPISSSGNEERIILRMTFRNNILEPGTPLAVGYIFRNAKGQEIASTNSYIEGLMIEAPIQGCYVTIRIQVHLPCLHPGSYAFSLTAGCLNQHNDITVSDRIENALAFDVHSKRTVHTLMNFATEFEIET